MLDQAAVAVVTGAAGNVIAYMVNGRIDALRTRIARLLHRKSTEEQTDVLKILEDDVLALQRQATSEADLKAKWTAILMGQLAARPELRDDLKAFATAAPEKTIHIGSQHNHGSGVFIAGDNHGGFEMSSHKEER